MTGFTWPVDKLTCIQRACSLTHNNVPNILNDGSDEFNTADAAYDGALAVMTEEENWGFCTKVVTLTPSPTAPADTDWDTAYDLPSDLIHIVWVKQNRNVGDPTANQLNQLSQYDILNKQLVINSQGGPPPPSPPQTPAIVTMKYASFDNADPTNGTPLFVQSLTYYVMAGLYRGMNLQYAESDKMYQLAEHIVQKARSRYDMQRPKRQFWNSRITAARRIRRPWPPTGSNWGSSNGSGIPG